MYDDKVSLLFRIEAPDYRGLRRPDRRDSRPGPAAVSERHGGSRMNRIYVFADEAGNFDFSAGRGASRYFILTTVTMGEFAVGDALLELRRQLAWEGIEQATHDFHATEEKQAVRDRVFAALAPWDFRIDATILEKRKARPHLAQDEVRFYKTAWFLHFKYVAPRIVRAGDELLIIAASLGTRTKRAVFHQAIQDVVSQVTPSTQFRTAAWSAASDPCLWVADYCCWAIQRKWERGDDRSYALIPTALEYAILSGLV